MKVSNYQRYARSKKKITTQAKSSKCNFKNIATKRDRICISSHIHEQTIQDIDKIVENLNNLNKDFKPKIKSEECFELKIPLHKIDFGSKRIKRISESKDSKPFKISNTYCKQFKFSRIGRTYEN